MRDLAAWVLGLGLGLGLFINGVAMFGLPASWYAAVPGVAATGPFNPHFVRDIGVASLVAGAGLIAFTVWPAARGAALAGAAFLALHAGVHLWDAAAGREHAHQLLIDLPTVFLPPALALWIALAPAARGTASKGEGEAR